MKREHWLIPDSPYLSYEAYLADAGPSAVITARGMNSDAVLEEVQRSGLRGRGGAGFPTGVKWRTLRQHPCETRSVVCNAAEGEPGTFKDRYLLRRNPYACIDGLLIAAHVVGAREIYIGIKTSFMPEIERLRSAIAEMGAAGLFADLGITIVEGPEEYLFGEEKALLNFIEEGEPLPREAHYPPYEKGLFATPLSPNPALVNNVETYVHVPGIIRAGATSFRALGTSDTPGTVIYTVSGDVKRPGVYEREAGIPLRTLFYDIAGGPRAGRIKAAVSGVASGVITPDKFDTPADFGSLALIGAGLGSAGLIVFDETRSMPRVAQALTRFLYVESCNQCTACKQGLRTASTALDEMFDVRTATADDFERARYGARAAPQANRCYLPVQGAVLIPSVMERFKDEFDVQLAAPSASSDPFTVPLIVDFDEASGTFLYDTTFVSKNPDWTYTPPPPAERRKRAMPARVPTGTIGVRLAQDVLEALLARAETEGTDLDRLVNTLLRNQLIPDDE
jgi:NADH:ubiquinone oxidoreductase subunit F (NADH-binding)